MQNPNKIYISAQADTASFTGPALRTQQWVYSTFMAYFSEATAAGTIQLQFSNDPSGNQSPANFVPVNWMNVPGTQATATVTAGASVVVYPPAGFVCQWMRVVFTRTGGAGTFSVAFDALFA